MRSSLQLQLGVELTNIFPVLRIADLAYHKIVSLARDLRKSGSDFLVEEELADIFGRGRINSEVERQFKDAVLKDVDVLRLKRKDGTSLEIALDSRPGPTLERAVRQDPTKAYLSTLVQLSLLTWTHDRASLATCLSECMEIRYLSGAPGASDYSGVEAIHSMLDTCASQCGTFNWNSYVQRIEYLVAERCPGFFRQKSFTALTPKLLLACMDYFFILQKLPEDRMLVIESQQAFVTLIIWSHYCLDLNVILAGVPGGDILFGSNTHKSRQVIIKWKSSGSGVVDPDVCLFDSSMTVVLQPDELRQRRIESCERLPLEDFGTTMLWRWMNTETAISQNSDIYIDAVQYTLALAIAKVPHLLRFSWDSNSESTGQLQIRRWQIYDVAEVIFASASYDRAAIEMYVHKMDGRDPLIAIEPPVRLRTHWEKINHRPGGLLPVQMHILRLSVLVIVLASVVGIRNCGQLPLVADVSWLEVVGFTSKAISHTAPHLVDSTDLYYSVAQMMVGGINKFGTEEMATGESSFMISEHGWTLFLSSVGAADPALAVPEQLFLRKGVPTKESTNERRYRVRDADANTEVHEENPMMPCRKILDRGNMYVPRCVEHVVERVEYYATTRNDFRLDIQHSIEASEIARRFAISRSLRSFHDGLWNSIMAPSCSHEEKEYDSKPVELPPGVAAGTALDWDEDAAPDRGEPEMVCIALTKNDPNIRWLSVAMSERKVMIRGPSTCVICAVSSAASLPGKWLVLI